MRRNPLVVISYLEETNDIENDSLNLYNNLML